jgi:hypothetical protein
MALRVNLIFTFNNLQVKDKYSIVITDKYNNLQLGQKHEGLSYEYYVMCLFKELSPHTHVL